MASNLNKPWKYKNYLIWPNTAFDNMKYYTVGCENALNGLCINNLSIKDCIDQSTGTGYHVQFKNGNSLCVPLRNDYNDVNLVYKLVNQEIHHELNDVSISTFLDANIYPFPPEYPNVIFYFDILKIKNIESQLFLNVIDNKYINFEKNKNSILQFVPSVTYRKGIVKYKPIMYGDEINIIIPGTSLILSQNIDNENFEFIESLIYNYYDENNNINNFTFKIYPLDENGVFYKEKLNKPVTYNDNFTLIYSQNNVTIVDKYKKLSGLYGNINQLIERNDPNIFTTFKAISKMEGYYCEDNVCKPVEISETKSIFDYLPLLKKYKLNENDIGKIYKDIDNIKELKYFKSYKPEVLRTEKIYKNTTVSRNKNCWGICNYFDKKMNDIPPYSTEQPPIKFLNTKNNFYIPILIFILFIIVIFIFLKKIKV